MSPSYGKLISIEGGEGAGKSTVLNAISSYLQQAGKTVISTREPGGTTVGEKIRQVLLTPEHRMNANTELLLMFASRAELVAETILPALALGHFVLSDRFTDASYAYQGGGRGIAQEKISLLEQHFVGLKPDLTLLLDVGVEQGMARAQARGQDFDRIELEKTDFFLKVRTAYLTQAAQEPERFVVIDASQSAESVVQSVLKALHQWLARAC